MEPQLIDQDSSLHGCCPDAVVAGGCRPGPLSTGSVFILARVPAAEKHSRAACQQARSANEPCVLRRVHTSLCLATTCDPGCVKTTRTRRSDSWHRADHFGRAAMPVSFLAEKRKRSRPSQDQLTVIRRSGALQRVHARGMTVLAGNRSLPRRRGRRRPRDRRENRCLRLPSRATRPARCLSSYARLVSEWVSGIGLDPLKFATHSMRRTKVTLIYRRARNLRAAQLLLGHTRIESTGGSSGE